MSETHVSETGPIGVTSVSPDSKGPIAVALKQEAGGLEAMAEQFSQLGWLEQASKLRGTAAFLRSNAHALRTSTGSFWAKPAVMQSEPAASLTGALPLATCSCHRPEEADAESPATATSPSDIMRPALGRWSAASIKAELQRHPSYKRIYDTCQSWYRANEGLGVTTAPHEMVKAWQYLLRCATGHLYLADEQETLQEYVARAVAYAESLGREE